MRRESHLDVFRWAVKNFDKLARRADSKGPCVPISDQLAEKFGIPLPEAAEVARSVCNYMHINVRGELNER